MNGADDLILIGVGANLRAPDGLAAIDTGRRALVELGRRGIVVRRASRWFRSAPVPSGPVPWFVNAVAVVETRLGADELLDVLHAVEAGLGRTRSAPNAPRTLDLDLLAFGRLARTGTPPVLPHPRMQDRAFVLRPLLEIAPLWRHPVTLLTAQEMLARLWPGQVCEPFLVST